MIDYLAFIETKGFWLRQVWDKEKKRMSGAGKMYLFPHQKRIFGKVLTFNEKDELPYETVMYSATKKSAKTTIAASVGAWYLEEAPPGTEIFVIANTLEAGEGRVMRDIQFHFQKRIEEGIYSDNRRDVNFCNLTQYRVELNNGSFIQVLAQSFKSVAGSRHSLTLWDELWGATSEFDRRVWDEMTQIPTVNNSLRFISTYAGFENESDLLWEMYIRGVDKDEHPDGKATRVAGLEDLPCWENGNLFTYWTHEPTMPWQTEKYLDEQLLSERPSAYIRLHTNNWVTSQEEFIPISWFDHASKAYVGSANIWGDHPFRNWPITIGIDAGIKRDSTALVGVGYDSHRGKVGIVFHYVWTPSKEDQVDLEATVVKELLYLYNKYKVVSIVCDPTHLMQSILELKRKGLPIREFTQSANNMTAASQALYELLKNKNLESYPDDVLRRHIQMAVALTTSRGFRIVKDKNRVSQRHQIDAAIALAMACYEAVENGGVDISIPVIIRSPFMDQSALIDDTQQDIPFELRN